jgi:hypothetical protein
VTEKRVPFIDGPTGEPREYVTKSYVFDPKDPQPDYIEIELVNRVPEAWQQLTDATTEPDFTHEETYRLALESAQRWLNNYRLSPAMRLRALRTVVQSALSDG